jgi:hypothetical protein
METIKLRLFYCRDFFVRNFMVDTKAIINNNQTINNQIIYFEGLKSILYWIIRILPFGFIRTIFGLFNLGLIYQLDSIFNITCTQDNRILPIILNCSFIKTVNSKEIIHDLSSKIKYYNGNIPIRFIIKENNLEKYKKIKLKYLNKGKLIEKSIDINDFINYSLYKLFEN